MLLSFFVLDLSVIRRLLYADEKSIFYISSQLPTLSLPFSELKSIIEYQATYLLKVSYQADPGQSAFLVTLEMSLLLSLLVYAAALLPRLLVMIVVGAAVVVAVVVVAVTAQAAVEQIMKLIGRFL